jgi:hypothetical protein
MNGCHDLFGRVGACNCENPGMGTPYDVAPRSEATGDDYAPVLRECFSDGAEGFFDSRIDEAAGVYDHEVSLVVAGGDEISLGAKLRQNPLGINEGLGAAKGYEADLR